MCGRGMQRRQSRSELLVAGYIVQARLDKIQTSRFPSCGFVLLGIETSSWDHENGVCESMSVIGMFVRRGKPA